METAPFFKDYRPEQVKRLYQNSLDGLTYMRDKLKSTGKPKYNGYTLEQLEKFVKEYTDKVNQICVN